MAVYVVWSYSEIRYLYTDAGWFHIPSLHTCSMCTILHNSNKKQFCCTYVAQWYLLATSCDHVHIFSHLASLETISLMPALSPLPHWSRQSLSQHCGKTCSDSHESLEAGKCMALFAVHVQHFMIRSLKFEAQYLQICRYNYAVATLLLETHLLLFVAWPHAQCAAAKLHRLLYRQFCSPMLASVSPAYPYSLCVPAHQALYSLHITSFSGSSHMCWKEPKNESSLQIHTKCHKSCSSMHEPGSD